MKKYRILPLLLIVCLLLTAAFPAAAAKNTADNSADTPQTVSYTHLTLPTNSLV